MLQKITGEGIHVRVGAGRPPLAEILFVGSKGMIHLVDLDNLYRRPLAALVVLHVASDGVRACFGKRVLPLGCEIRQWHKMASPGISPAGR